MTRAHRLSAPLLFAASLAGGPARGEDEKTTVAAVAGARYKAGPIHRWILGSGYRREWATPVRMEVLNLRTEAGGLTPVKKGGGKQTKSLRFRAADGREFRVRSVDKDPSAALPPELRDTFAEAIVQDQISASHPAAPLVVDALAEAAGIVHVKRRLVVVPDDPLLGEFRDEFKGMVATFEEEPRLQPPVTPGFEGITKIVDWEELTKALDGDSRERVDSRALLRARLFDMFVGDWDRHQGQWDFARKEGHERWLPIPTDRDVAFSHFDGLALALARPSQPRLVKFEDEYPTIVGLGWNARFVDRRLLADLPRPAYGEVARELQRSLTDGVIAAAVRALPPEYYATSGARLTERLRARRDRLPEVAEAFYEMLAAEVEVHATDEADLAEVVREDGRVLVRLRPGKDEPPYYERAFDPAETEEVRIFLEDGDDLVVSRGQEPAAIKVRAVGGKGEDTVDDSAGGRTHFYDSEGESRVVDGPGTEESDEPYVSPLTPKGNPQRDWGKATLVPPWVSAGGDMGVLVGLGVQTTTYGFRKHPYASRHEVRAAYSTALRTGKVEYEGHWHYTNSRRRWDVLLRASGAEVVRFHGFGNETAAPREGDFYKTPQRQFLLEPLFTFGLSGLELSLGPAVKFTTTDLEPGRFLTLARPYGSDDFGQVGARARLVIDRRDHPVAPHKGALLWAEGSFYPEAWDVRKAFGEVHGEAAAYVPLGGGHLNPTFALRAGGKQLWPRGPGAYPFHEAAFLGGPETLRGLRRQRYAGDAAAWGSAELRVRLAKFFLLVPSEMGIFGLADGGRVWFEGESSDEWHHGVGGGIWLSFLKPENTVSLAAARSEGRTRLYFQAGFGF